MKQALAIYFGISTRVLALIIALCVVGCTAPPVVETDTDNDGVVDSQDAFPDDPNESVDTDNDGEGNQAEIGRAHV